MQLDDTLINDRFIEALTAFTASLSFFFRDRLQNPKIKDRNNHYFPRIGPEDCVKIFKVL